MLTAEERLEQSSELRLAVANALQTAIEEKTGASVYVDFEEDYLCIFAPKEEADKVLQFLRSFGKVLSTFDEDTHRGFWMQVGGRNA